jgi:hypothetical protein
LATATVTAPEVDSSDSATSTSASSAQQLPDSADVATASEQHAPFSPAQHEPFSPVLTAAIGQLEHLPLAQLPAAFSDEVATIVDEQQPLLHAEPVLTSCSPLQHDLPVAIVAFSEQQLPFMTFATGALSDAAFPA